MRKREFIWEAWFELVWVEEIMRKSVRNKSLATRGTWWGSRLVLRRKRKWGGWERKMRITEKKMRRNERQMRRRVRRERGGRGTDEWVTNGRMPLATRRRRRHQAEQEEEKEEEEESGRRRAAPPSAATPVAIVRGGREGCFHQWPALQTFTTLFSLLYNIAISNICSHKSL